MHYNGHGVPKPTSNGELWVYGKHYSHYMAVSIADVRAWLGEPSIYVLDCSGAGVLIPFFADEQAGEESLSPLPSPRASYRRSTQPRAPELKSISSMQSIRSAGHSMSNLEAQADSKCIVMAACKADETLPLNPLYPHDIFTSCLTTPIPTAVRWFIIQVKRSR